MDPNTRKFENIKVQTFTLEKIYNYHDVFIYQN